MAMEEVRAAVAAAPGDAAAEASGASGESLSCVTCRNRKLKCDRVRPVCTRCARVRGECVYPESRRKPAVKRRNVKELEARLAQVEGLLKDVGAGEGRPAAAAAAGQQEAPADEADEAAEVAADFDSLEVPMTDDVMFQGLDYAPYGIASFDVANDPAGSTAPPGQMPGDNAFQLMDLGGMFEALPPFEVMEELNRIFFEHQQHTVPIIHPTRYMQSFYSAPHMKPPMCLQYVMWAVAATVSPKYQAYQDFFYQRARQYAEADEMKGQGEHFITVAHAQAWCIMATYEAKTMRFTRAAMSGARAIRLVHILGLHMLDSPHEDSEAPSLVPPKDWAELEERRRTFWGVFTIDSHCSVSTGWPNLLDSSQITTHLPASESAFHSGEAVETCTLHDVFKGWHSYSSFGGFAVVCHIFNQLLQHVHRPKPNDNPGDFEHGDYWKRHRDIDNILSNTFMFLPEFFRLPENYRDPTAVHTNLNLHAGVICLHIAAAEKIDDYNLPEQAKAISLNRLRTSAQEIVDIIKLTSHLRSGPKSPLAALSLYVAASASIYMCQEMRTPTSADNLNFIISAMEAIGRDHHVTRGFLGQVLADIEHSGIQAYVQIPRLDNWKADFNAGFTPHNIPLLARSRVSRHSKRQPPLPGRLPLGKPMGKVISEDGGTRDLWHSPPATADCPFASYTGEKSSDGNANKRKRTASSTPGGASGHSEPLFHGSNDLTDSSRTATSSSHSSPQDTLNALSSVQSTTSANLASSGAETLKLPHRVWSPAWNNMSMDQKEAQACHDPSPRRRANDQSNFDAGFGSIFAGPGQSQLPQKSREVEASEWSTAGLDIPSQPKPDTGTALHTAIRADAGAFNFIRPEDLTLDWNEFGANFGMSETPTGPGLKDGVPTGQGK